MWDGESLMDSTNTSLNSKGNASYPEGKAVTHLLSRGRPSFTLPSPPLIPETLAAAAGSAPLPRTYPSAELAHRLKARAAPLFDLVASFRVPSTLSSPRAPPTAGLKPCLSVS